MAQERARRRAGSPTLVNPYSAAEGTRDPRSPAVVVGAAVVGAAGLVVLGGGAAAADEGDGADGTAVRLVTSADGTDLDADTGASGDLLEDRGSDGPRDLLSSAGPRLPGSGDDPGGHERPAPRPVWTAAPSSGAGDLLDPAPPEPTGDPVGPVAPDGAVDVVEDGASPVDRLLTAGDVEGPGPRRRADVEPVGVGATPVPSVDHREAAADLVRGGAPGADDAVAPPVVTSPSGDVRAPSVGDPARPDGGARLVGTTDLDDTTSSDTTRPAGPLAVQVDETRLDPIQLDTRPDETRLDTRPSAAEVDQLGTGSGGADTGGLDARPTGARLDAPSRETDGHHLLDDPAVEAASPTDAGLRGAPDGSSADRPAPVVTPVATAPGDAVADGGDGTVARDVDAVPVPARGGDPTAGTTGDREGVLVAALPGVVSDTPMDLGLPREAGREVLVAAVPAQPLGGEPVDPTRIFDPAQRGMVEFAQGPAAEFLDSVLDGEYQDDVEVGEALRRFISTYPEYLGCDLQLSCVTVTAADGTTTIAPGSALISRAGETVPRPFGTFERTRVPQDAAGVGTVTVHPPVFDGLDNDAANFPAVTADQLRRLSQLAFVFPRVPAVTGTSVDGFTGDTLTFEVPRSEGTFGPEIGMPERYELSNPLGLPVADRIRILDRTYDVRDPMPDPLSGDFRVDVPPGTRIAPPGTTWSTYAPDVLLNGEVDEALAEERRDVDASLRLFDLDLLEPTSEEDVRRALARFEHGYAAGDHDPTPFWRQRIADPWDGEPATSEPALPPVEGVLPLLPDSGVRGLLPPARDAAEGSGADPAAQEDAPTDAGERPSSGAPSDGVGQQDPSGGSEGSAGPRGRGVFGPVLRPGSIEDLLEQMFPGGNPKEAPAEPGPEDTQPSPPVEFDPNDVSRGEAPPVPPGEIESFPDGHDLGLGLDGAGPRFTFPAGPESEDGREGGVDGRVDRPVDGRAAGGDGAVAVASPALVPQLVRDLLAEPVTITRSGRTYRAAGGVPFTPSSYVGVYDESGALIAAEKGEPPARIDVGRRLDERTGVVAAAVAAVPLLAGQLLPAVAGGTQLASGFGALVPALPAVSTALPAVSTALPEPAAALPAPAREGWAGLVRGAEQAWRSATAGDRPGGAPTGIAGGDRPEPVAAAPAEDPLPAAVPAEPAGGDAPDPQPAVERVQEAVAAWTAPVVQAVQQRADDAGRAASAAVEQVRAAAQPLADQVQDAVEQGRAAVESGLRRLTGGG